MESICRCKAVQLKTGVSWLKPQIYLRTQISLNGASSLEQSGELLLLALEVGVSTDVLLVDEDVGHAALVGHFLEGVLNSRAVICNTESQYACIQDRKQSALRNTDEV